MAFPLIPLLIGAGIGAAMDEENRLRGAAMGGVLGAFTGGMGASAAGAGKAAAGASAAGANTAAATGAKVAATEGAKVAATEGAKAAASKSLWQTLTAKAKSPETSARLGMGLLSPKPSPTISAPPQQQREFKPAPSVQERLARVGGNEPLFVPKSIFEEEKMRMEDEELLALLRERGVA